MSFFSSLSKQEEIYPFDGDTIGDVNKSIKNGKFTMLEHISLECKDLISQMLIVDPDKRISSEQILKHPWIVNN
jgi:serine/threonine protein kinase